MTLKKIKAALAVGAAAFSLFAYSPEAAAFQEYPIGDEQESVDNHFKVALVYFQPVPMEPGTARNDALTGSSRYSH